MSLQNKTPTKDSPMPRQDDDQREGLIDAGVEKPEVEKDRAYNMVTVMIGILMVVTGSLNTLAARMADLVKFDSDTCVEKFDWPPKAHASEVGANEGNDWKPQFQWPYNAMCPGGQPDDPPLEGLLTREPAYVISWNRTEVDTSKTGYSSKGESLPVDFHITMPTDSWVALAVWPCGGDGRAGGVGDIGEPMCNEGKHEGWAEKTAERTNIDVMVAYSSSEGGCGVEDMWIDSKGELVSDKSLGCQSNVLVPFAACQEQKAGKMGSTKMVLRRFAETQDYKCDNRLPEHGFFLLANGSCPSTGPCVPSSTANLADGAFTNRTGLLPYDAYGSECPDQDYRCSFNHPFFQADLMFLGEFSCLIVYWILCKCCDVDHPWHPGVASPGFKFWLFALPAFCDMFGTGLMYVGLTLVFSSVFQMIRGSVVVFTMFFSYVLLGKKPWTFQYVAAALIVIGLALVGVATFLGTGSGCGAGSDASSMLLGILIIVASQVITAFQMTIEEKFLGEHSVPALMAVGLEGAFGMLFISILIIPFHWIPTPFAASGMRSWPTQYLEDIPTMGKQIACNPLVVLPLLGTSCSIAFFNFAGMSITKRVSATVRMVLDSVRTLVIWTVSLILHTWIEDVQGYNKLQFGWQAFGFVILLVGIAMYNRLVTCKGLEPPFSEPVPETAELMSMRREKLIALATRMGMTPDQEDEIMEEATAGGGNPDEIYTRKMVDWIDSHRPTDDEVFDEPLAGDGSRSHHSRGSTRSSVAGLGKLQAMR